MPIAPNLTVVLQQTHDVSKVQEITQRQSELQQQVAAQEVQQRQAKERSQIQASGHSEADNKITPDGGREQQHKKRDRARAQTSAKESADNKIIETADKGLFDVVV